MQRMLNHARWDADAVRDALRTQVGERIGSLSEVLAVDDTGFEKSRRIAKASTVLTPPGAASASRRMYRPCT
jgi:SRSO17 transposase